MKWRERERTTETRQGRERDGTTHTRTTALPEMKVGFGRFKGRTCESICKEARGHCESISRQDPTNPAPIAFPEFIQIAEREWENESREKKKRRRELEKRETNLEEHRRAAESEMEERQQLLQEAKNMLAEMDAEVRFWVRGNENVLLTLWRRQGATTTRRRPRRTPWRRQGVTRKEPRRKQKEEWMGMETPRNKMMIGVNTESGT